MGKRKCISPEIAKLVHRLQAQKESYTTIGAMFGHSKRWVCYIIKNFDPESGEPRNPKQMGCKRKTTAEQDQQILELFENNKNMTKNAARTELEKTIGKIGFSTIARRLKEAKKSVTKMSAAMVRSGTSVTEPPVQTMDQEAVCIPIFPQLTIPDSSSLASLFGTLSTPMGVVLPLTASFQGPSITSAPLGNSVTEPCGGTSLIIVNVRPAVPEDCDGICARIYELARNQGFPRGPSITPERLRQDIFPSRRDGSVVFAYVAQELRSGKIVGYALYHFLYSSWEGRSMLLEDIYVEPAYRQSDIGKRLLANVCKQTLEKGCEVLRLNVFRDKSGGKAFQESCGLADPSNNKDKMAYGKLDKKVLEAIARGADAEVAE